MPTFAGLFVVPSADDTDPTPAVRKAAGSSLLLGFDFGNLPEVWDGGVVSGATLSVTPSGPTLGSPQYIGSPTAYRVGFTCSGGSPTGGAVVDGVQTGDYTITCSATVGTSTISATGILRVY